LTYIRSPIMGPLRAVRAVRAGTSPSFEMPGNGLLLCNQTLLATSFLLLATTVALAVLLMFERRKQQRHLLSPTSNKVDLSKRVDLAQRGALPQGQEDTSTGMTAPSPSTTPDTSCTKPASPPALALDSMGARDSYQTARPPTPPPRPSIGRVSRTSPSTTTTSGSGAASYATSTLFDFPPPPASMLRPPAHRAPAHEVRPLHRDAVAEVAHDDDDTQSSGKKVTRALAFPRLRSRRASKEREAEAEAEDIAPCAPATCSSVTGCRSYTRSAHGRIVA